MYGIRRANSHARIYPCMQDTRPCTACAKPPRPCTLAMATYEGLDSHVLRQSPHVVYAWPMLLRCLTGGGFRSTSRSLCHHFGVSANHEQRLAHQDQEHHVTAHQSPSLWRPLSINSNRHQVTSTLWYCCLHNTCHQTASSRGSKLPSRRLVPGGNCLPDRCQNDDRLGPGPPACRSTCPL